MWTGLFGDAITLPTTRPRPLTALSIELEGHQLPVVEVPRGDIAPCAVLHISPLEAVIAGDVCYNQIHQMLALGGPAQWQEWSASVDLIAGLRPRVVVAGHKKPEAPDDDVVAILDGTRHYLRAFAEEVATHSDAAGLVAAMTARYPHHGNLTTLVFSAAAAMKAKARAAH